MNKEMEKFEFSKYNTLALKGIAIIMMMFHHCFYNKSKFKNFTVSFWPFKEEFVIDLSLTFKICVSIFVFITGYGLILSLKKLNSKYDWTKKEIIKWTANRLIKMLAGFWIIAIISYVTCQIIDGRTVKVFFKEGIAYGIIKLILNFFGMSDLFGTPNFNSAWWYMNVAVLFILSVPVFTKLFKKYNYVSILLLVIFIPRIIGWKYVNSCYISFLFPLLLGMIFAEKNLMVKIANFSINKNIYLNKILKLIIETVLIIILYKLYTELPREKFWEIRYGIIPIVLICYLYEFFLDLPILKNILIFLGKHSMNIFLIHEFIRTYYLTEWLYSFRNWIKIAIILLVISLLISIILELLKKVIRYDKLINKLQEIIEGRLLLREL